jgi:hypothetical protein
LRVTVAKVKTNGGGGVAGFGDFFTDDFNIGGAQLGKAAIQFCG